MSLEKYIKKRNFDKTSEPRGNVKKTKSNRFVVQFHQARAKHYDFRLEYNGVLLSWAVPKGISENFKIKRLAVKVEDHPVDYINFEGVIPKGNYGAGTVEIFDKGKYVPLKEMEKGLKTGHIKIFLVGEKLYGAWSLIKTDGDNWLIVKIEDGIDKRCIKKQVEDSGLPFKKTEVMLATLSQKIPKTKGWLSEIKYDGYRMVTFAEKGKVQMFSRNHVSYTKKFTSVCDAVKKVEQSSFVLDGEIVSFDQKGKSDFGLLQQNIRQKKDDYYYVIFDLLALNGEDLRELPLTERKNKLERILFKADERLIYSSHVEDAEKCFEFAKQNELEGIVMKKTQSQYQGGRSENWLKIKNNLRREFVIGGYTTSDKNSVISAILVGYYEKNSLIYVGKVGTGLDYDKKQELKKLFNKLTVKVCPFKNGVKEKNANWIKPEIVAEIKFTEFTKDGRLRQPSFVGLREDKTAKQVGKE